MSSARTARWANDGPWRMALKRWNERNTPLGALLTFAASKSRSREESRFFLPRRMENPSAAGLPPLVSSARPPAFEILAGRKNLRFFIAPDGRFVCDSERFSPVACQHFLLNPDRWEELRFLIMPDGKPSEVGSPGPVSSACPPSLKNQPCFQRKFII